MGAIVFTPRADADLTRLRDFLATKSTRAADAAKARIVEALDLLLMFPEAGVALRGPVRQLHIKHGRNSYTARYVLLGDDIVITRIWHGKENRPR